MVELRHGSQAQRTADQQRSKFLENCDGRFLGLDCRAGLTTLWLQMMIRPNELQRLPPTLSTNSCRNCLKVGVTEVLLRF